MLPSTHGTVLALGALFLSGHYDCRQDPAHVLEGEESPTLDGLVTSLLNGPVEQETVLTWILQASTSIGELKPVSSEQRTASADAPAQWKDCQVDLYSFEDGRGSLRLMITGHKSLPPSNAGADVTVELIFGFQTKPEPSMTFLNFIAQQFYPQDEVWAGVLSRPSRIGAGIRWNTNETAWFSIDAYHVQCDGGKTYFDRWISQDVKLPSVLLQTPESSSLAFLAANLPK